MSDPNPTTTANAASMPAFSESNDAPLFTLEDTTATSHQPQPLLFGGGSNHAGPIGSTANNSSNNNTNMHAFATFGAPQLPAPHHGSGSSQQAALLAGSPASMPSPGGSQLQPQLLDSEGHVVSLSTPDAQNRNIYVASLPNNFSDDNLRDLFLPFGGIVSSKMFNNDGRPGSHGRAYGFVMFAEEGSVQKAIDALVGAVVGSQRIQVRRAKPTARGPSQPGSANPTPMNSSSQPVLTPQQATGMPSPPQQHHQPMQQPPPQQQQQQPPQQSGGGGNAGVLMIQPGGTVTLQHVGSNALGQPIFLTPTGQQVVLAAPSAPLSQGVAPPPAMQPQPSAQAFSSGNQAPHLMPMGASSGAQPVLMPGTNSHQQPPQQHQQQGGSPANGGGFFFQR